MGPYLKTKNFKYVNANNVILKKIVIYFAKSDRNIILYIYRNQGKIGGPH